MVPNGRSHLGIALQQPGHDLPLLVEPPQELGLVAVEWQHHGELVSAFLDEPAGPSLNGQALRSEWRRQSAGIRKRRRTE
jgi:hypothetical protein